MSNSYTKYLKDELTDHVVYERLAKTEKKPENKALLLKLSAQEQSHYEFWKTLAPETAVSASSFVIYGVLLMRKILGVTFTVKFLELHEEHVIEEYKEILKALPETHKARLSSIIEDEIAHEKSLMSQLKEQRIKYVGFIALGLADAIVEITGVHAGFLGVTGSTLIAGVSGLIVGFAAAISMASASYIQAKQDTERSAIVSATTTGVSYIFSVICLALPYFLFSQMISAFSISTLVGILLIAGFTFYGAVVFDRKFLREFAEAVFLMLGTAVATFILGEVLGKTFGLGANRF